MFQIGGSCKGHQVIGSIDKGVTPTKARYHGPSQRVMRKPMGGRRLWRTRDWHNEVQVCSRGKLGLVLHHKHVDMRYQCSGRLRDQIRRYASFDKKIFSHLHHIYNYAFLITRNGPLIDARRYTGSYLQL